MTTEELRTLLDYDAWATRQLLDAASALSPEEFGREFAASYSSLRQQCSHLVATVDNYRRALQNDEPLTPTELDFATAPEAIAAHIRVREYLDAYLGTLSPASLNEVPQGADGKKTFLIARCEVLRHAVNHGTYHRGQIAFLLKLHGADFPETDYIAWLSERSQPREEKPQP